MFSRDKDSPLMASELQRLSIIRRYASVAYELPPWAHEILCSKMGTIEVSAKDSFEIYISGLKDAVPKYDFVAFQKRFAEIFVTKAFVALEKIGEHRKKNLNYYVSNDYFWQEFKDLFEVGGAARKRKKCVFRRCVGPMWCAWNRRLLGACGLGRSVSKVGITGLVADRRILSKRDAANIRPIKWR